MLRHWSVLESKPILITPWFELHKDRCQTPEGSIVQEYYTWKKRDCVIVFPLTTDNHIVLIKQYRHGIGRICIDYPGGTIEKSQSVLDAAKYELLEETGYNLESCYPIGCYTMDSSYSNQMVHFVVATGCEKVSEPDHPQEITEVIKLPVSRLSILAEKEIDCMLCSLLTVKALNYLSHGE